MPRTEPTVICGLCEETLVRDLTRGWGVAEIAYAGGHQFWVSCRRNPLGNGRFGRHQPVNFTIRTDVEEWLDAPYA